MTPGSFPWLLANDLRLHWRQATDVFASWSRFGILLFLVSGLVLAHGFAWWVFSMKVFPENFAQLISGGAFLWLIAQGLLGTTRALFERGTLEVLFSSPLAEWKAVTSRMIAIAAFGAGSLAPLALPFANAGMWMDTPAWIIVYPGLLAAALIGTAAGLLLAMVLFKLAGPRRARLFAQVLSAVIGGGFILSAQISLILPKELAGKLTGALGSITSIAGGSLQSAAAKPPFEAALLVGGHLLAAVVLFACAVALLSGVFAEASREAAGADESIGLTTRRDRPFRTGAAAVLRMKEWRLLMRDPNLFAQLGLQIVYTLPLAFLLLRSGMKIPPVIALVPLLVVLAAQISASLAWLTVSGEDAPDLIATAPLAPGQALRAKALATAIPLAVILALPMLGLLSVSFRGALYALVFGAMAAASTALLNFWNPNEGNRRRLLHRHSQSKVIAMAEHGISLLWSVGVVIAFIYAPAVAIPLVLIAWILWSFRPKSRRAVSRPAAA